MRQPAKQIGLAHNAPGIPAAPLLLLRAARPLLAPRWELMQRRWLMVDRYSLRQRGHLCSTGALSS